MILFACCCVLVAVLLLFIPSASKAPAKNLKRERNKTTEAHNHPSELILDVSASLLDSGMPIKEILDTLGRSVPHSEQLCTVARCLEMNMEWDKAWHSVPPWLHPLEKGFAFRSRDRGTRGKPIAQCGVPKAPRTKPKSRPSWSTIWHQTCPAIGRVRSASIHCLRRRAADYCPAAGVVTK